MTFRLGFGFSTSVSNNLNIRNRGLNGKISSEHQTNDLFASMCIEAVRDMEEVVTACTEL